jgi:hypothetical protein
MQIVTPQTSITRQTFVFSRNCWLFVAHLLFYVILSLSKLLLWEFCSDEAVANLLKISGGLALGCVSNTNYYFKKILLQTSDSAKNKNSKSSRYVQASCAQNGDGLFDGIQWLTGVLSKKWVAEVSTQWWTSRTPVNADLGISIRITGILDGSVRIRWCGSGVSGKELMRKQSELFLFQTLDQFLQESRKFVRKNFYEHFLQESRRVAPNYSNRIEGTSFELMILMSIGSKRCWLCSTSR